MDSVQILEAKNMKILPFKDIHHHKFLVDSGTMVTVTNKLNWNYRKEAQGRFIIKRFREESFNIFWSLQSKYAEITEISPFNGICHWNIPVHPGTMITVKDKLNGNYGKEAQLILSGKWVRQVFEQCSVFTGKICRKYWNLTFQWCTLL